MFGEYQQEERSDPSSGSYGSDIPRCLGGRIGLGRHVYTFTGTDFGPLAGVTCAGSCCDVTIIG